MFRFGLLFVLIVMVLIFVWVCAASFFKPIGKFVSKFFEPFKNSTKEND